MRILCKSKQMILEDLADPPLLLHTTRSSLLLIKLSSVRTHGKGNVDPVKGPHPGEHGEVAVVARKLITVRVQASCYSGVGGVAGQADELYRQSVHFCLVRAGCYVVTRVFDK